jgi:hypothetical protein
MIGGAFLLYIVSIILIKNSPSIKYGSPLY